MRLTIPPTKSREDAIRRLSLRLRQVWRDPQDRLKVEAITAALDAKYSLGDKLAREEGVQDILLQMTGRIALAFGNISAIRGQRILDIASGSNTSRAPASLFVNSPLGERRMGLAARGYTALFEPWFCRLLVELGAEPVGVDMGDLEGEAFEHYWVDLGQRGALDFLPDHSFDAAQDSRLFGSPEFTAQFPDPAERLRVAGEIWYQEQRVLKPGGIVIHSDAGELLSQ